MAWEMISFYLVRLCGPSSNPDVFTPLLRVVFVRWRNAGVGFFFFFYIFCRSLHWASYWEVGQTQVDILGSRSVLSHMHVFLFFRVEWIPGVFSTLVHFLMQVRTQRSHSGPRGGRSWCASRWTRVTKWFDSESTRLQEVKQKWHMRFDWNIFKPKEEAETEPKDSVLGGASQPFMLLSQFFQGFWLV